MDSGFGDDTTAVKYDMAHPYATLDAAVAAAVAGDLIDVRACSAAYTPTTNLAKNGVDWYFETGASVQGSLTNLFDASLASTSFSVTGRAVLLGADASIVLHTGASHTGSIYFEVLSIENASTSSAVHLEGNGDIVLHALRAIRKTLGPNSAVLLEGARTYIKTPAIEAFGTNVSALLLLGTQPVEATIDAATIRGQFAVVHNNSSAQSTLSIRAHTISNTDAVVAAFTASGGAAGSYSISANLMTAVPAVLQHATTVADTFRGEVSVRHIRNGGGAITSPGTLSMSGGILDVTVESIDFTPRAITLTSGTLRVDAAKVVGAGIPNISAVIEQTGGFFQGRIDEILSTTVNNIFQTRGPGGTSRLATKTATVVPGGSRAINLLGGGQHTFEGRYETESADVIFAPGASLLLEDCTLVVRDSAGASVNGGGTFQNRAIITNVAAVSVPLNPTLFVVNPAVS